MLKYNVHDICYSGEKSSNIEFDNGGFGVWESGLTFVAYLPRSCLCRIVCSLQPFTLSCLETGRERKKEKIKKRVCCCLPQG